MPRFPLKKLIPHGIVIVCFLLVAVVFCKPVLDGQVLNQGDIVGWKGMAQNSFEYKEKNGHFPLWNTHLFSGMPNYQVAMEGDSLLPNFTKILSLGLPKPINFLFLAALCFYILCVVMGLSPWIGLFGGLAYMLSTYNPIIIGAGHESKMLALAFLPLMFAGILALFQKRYWLGIGLTTFGIFQQIAVNHFQITYYAILIAVGIFFAYLTCWIKNKEWKHLGKVLAIGIIAGLVGLAGNALNLMTTSEYSQYTMRGGKNIEIKGNAVSKIKTTGLDYDYASRYSLGKAETVVLAMPDAFGSSSSEPLVEDSKVITKLTERGIPESNALQIASQMPRYWGGIVEGTSGPPYVGVITCLLALIGFALIKSPIRWGLLATSVFGTLLSWGKYFPSLNEFLFENLPFYNKFRAPSMSLTIVEFTFPLVAVLALHQILIKSSPEEIKKQFKTVLYVIGGTVIFLLGLGLFMDYGAPFDEQVMNFAIDPSGSKEINQLIVAGLKADREDKYMEQLLRFAGFSVLVAGSLFLFSKKWLKPIWIISLLALASTIDLFMVGKKYLDEEAYVESSTYESENFSASPIDQKIKADTDPHYRVFNLLGNPYNESRTSYFHRSIGGYHPAKLRIYQDLIDRYLSDSINNQVLDMLDTKYILQQNVDSAILRPTAMGPAWLVKNIQTTSDPVQALQSIGKMNLRESAIAEISDPKKLLAATTTDDSTARIGLTRFDNDTLTYAFESTQPQFAVFSEIYYPKGWNAYIDGKPAEHYKTNYVLRGLPVPAGKHEIQFIFEPESFTKGNQIGYASSALILLIVLGSLFMAWKSSQPEKEA
ncbi:MAG: YfhO family protein [Bacteroidetes bacterium]|nr:YfhO family protein [Bacteroidota bacterium]